MKKNRKYKRLHFIAVAALSAALLGCQIPVVLAAESRVESASGLKMEDLFPDNITVSDPVALSEVELPENKYGKLEWLDDSIELTERVQECEALFIPEKDIDVTDMKNWDKELGGVKGEIHVIVSSIAENEDEAADAELEEDSDISEDVQDEERIEEVEIEGEDSDVSEEVVVEQEAETPEVDATEDTEKVEEEAPAEGELQATTPEEDAQDQNSVEPEKEDSSEVENGSEEDIEEENRPETEGETGALEESVPEPEVTVTPEQEPSEDSSEEEQDNIFDIPADVEEDSRPTEVPENLTEEEKLQHAAVNHSCNGISVSGINLPWYVQFRATSGESYEFSNESDAMIFKSYEFELWDLQNNTEYEIPDGEYISVTVPVKEGYDYTIEHLLDNGAIETIIPNVEGSTMVFSTHSFSPFGIAGSLQLVGPDFPVDDVVKPTVTPTPSITGKPGEGGVSGGTGNNGTSGNAGTSAGDGNVSGGSGTSDNNSGDVNTGSGTGSVQNGGNSSQNTVSGNTGSAGSNQSGTSGNNVNTQNNGQSSNSHAVATGDTTAIIPFVILILAAMILIGAVVYIKTKKK